MLGRYVQRVLGLARSSGRPFATKVRYVPLLIYIEGVAGGGARSVSALCKRAVARMPD